MHSTEERVRMVRLRASQLEHKREVRSVGGFCVLCGALLGSLIGMMSTVVGSGQGSMPSGLFGTMLLYEDAGGYVLVAVISFMAAVVVTLVCVRSGSRRAKNENACKREEQEYHEE